MRSFCQIARSVAIHPLTRDIRIKAFSACDESVLLYDCETWLVTNELRRKIQRFFGICLRYVKNLVTQNHFKERALAVIWPNRHKYGDEEMNI
jgi:hypothetical protein